MPSLSRRLLLKTGATLGIAGMVPRSAVADEADSSQWESSPHLDKYVQALPIPEEREPDGRRRGAEYHEVPVEEAQHSFHPDLPDTTIWGFDGRFPGSIIAGRRNKRLMVHFDNSELPDEHLFEVDESIGGTTTENYVGYDGPVPEVRTVTHFHGLNVPPESDGQAEMWTSPGGVEGPRFSREVQELPNRQSRLTSTYHDHTRGITRLNVYAGLVGPYYVRSRTEDRLDLPDGDYDVPLVLADRSFEKDGSLHYPDEFVENFAGDVATVNGAAWPFLEVAPRRYRFRILNPSNGRTYGLALENAEEDRGEHGQESADVPTIYQISPGHGFLEGVVSIGRGCDMESLLVAPFERAEVIVDFSEHAGETFTLTNDAEFPFSGREGHDDGREHGDTEDADHDDMDGMGEESTDGGDVEENGMDHGGMDHGDGDHPQIHEIMQIRVADSGGERDRSAHPTDLNLPDRPGPNPKAARTTREITLDMVMGSDPGLHTLNRRRWGDEVEIQPQLGTTELWELENTSMHTHPIHLHLVDFEVVGRGPDGTEPPFPNERGGKDVVRVDPDETVRIAAKFGDFTGRYPFHCHVLEHEEHDMMRPFEVVTGNATDDRGGDDGGRPDRGCGPSDDERSVRGGDS